jgi:hypothetical protein
MIQTTSHLAAFEADIRQMRADLAENTEPRPLHEVEAEIFARFRMSQEHDRLYDSANQAVA